MRLLFDILDSKIIYYYFNIYIYILKSFLLINIDKLNYSYIELLWL